jgi:hypothetical protein
MSSLVLTGDTSGQVTLAAPAVAGTTTITMPAVTGTMTVLSATQSTVRVNTGNGVGGTLIAIRRFTNSTNGVNGAVQQGSDITYSDSAANGALFTINTNGVYAISYSDSFSAINYLGISLNTSAGATSIQSISVSERLVIGTTQAANNPMVCSWTGYLPSGSLIRPHVNASAADGTGPAQVNFTIVRVT